MNSRPASDPPSRLGPFRSFGEALLNIASRVRRREIAVFVAGFLLFLSGGANLIVTQQRATTSVGTSKNSRPGHTPVRKVVGRPAGESVAGYISRKKSLLASRAKKDPGAVSFAVVSFDSYRNPEQVEAFLSVNKLSVKAAILRVALEGLPAEEVRLSDSKASGALSAELRSRAAQESGRAEELEKIIPTVAEEEFRSVYLQDASRRRKAAEILSSGAVWFAVVVEAPLSALSKGGTAKEVRLVDIPEEPDGNRVTLDSHSFRGILPEES